MRYMQQRAWSQQVPAATPLAWLWLRLRCALGLMRGHATKIGGVVQDRMTFCLAPRQRCDAHPTHRRAPHPSHLRSGCSGVVISSLLLLTSPLYHSAVSFLLTPPYPSTGGRLRLFARVPREVWHPRAAEQKVAKVVGARHRNSRARSNLLHRETATRSEMPTSRYVLYGSGNGCPQSHTTPQPHASAPHHPPRANRALAPCAHHASIPANADGGQRQIAPLLAAKPA